MPISSQASRFRALGITGDFCTPDDAALAQASTVHPDNPTPVPEPILGWLGRQSMVRRQEAGVPHGAWGQEVDPVWATPIQVPYLTLILTLTPMQAP